MKSINKNAIKICYSPYEIMLFVTIWTYGIFGAFLTRSDDYLMLILGSFVPILLSYILLVINHHENKKTLEIEFDSLKMISIFFISMLILINDGLFSWFYNDQSAHVTEAFKHGILLGTILPGIENFLYKTLIHITNISILIFFISIIIFLRNQKNIYVKIFLVTIIFLFLRSIVIYFGGTQSVHPPLRLFPIFVSSTFFGINEFGIRIVQLILASSFLTYFFTILKKHFSNLNSILFTTLILTTPLFLFTSLSIEPSIYSFIIVTIFLIDIYNHLEGQKFSFSKWIFIISIGSLIRQSIFLLFIPLFMAYFLQKEWNIKSVGKLLSPFFVCLPIFLNSILSGTPSTNNLQMNSFLDNNYLEIFVSNLGIVLSLFIIISLIPNLKKLKSSFILTTTFLVLFFSFIIVPFYGYEFTYRYHAEYALPFAFLGLYRTCLYLGKLSYNRLITGILLLSIIVNITIYLPVFFPKKISFQSLLANNFSNYKNVYSFIVEENYENQFYYIGPNQRLISKIMYGLSIKNSINSTNPEHFNVETFATNLDFENIDEIIQNYNIIIIDTFETNTQNYDESPYDVSPYDVSPYTVDINKNNNYKNTVLYDINKHNKIVEYLESIPFEDKKIFNGSMGFKTLIFINGRN